MSENKTSAAQLRASRAYEKRNDRINIVFPAGTRERMDRLGIEKPGTFIKEVIAAELEKINVRLEIDSRSEKIGYKIREAQLEKTPYMLIIGDKEAESKTVSVRSRKNGDIGSMSVEEFVAMVNNEIITKAK